MSLQIKGAVYFNQEDYVFYGYIPGFNKKVDANTGEDFYDTCTTFGKTFEDCYRNIKQVAELELEEWVSKGKEVEEFVDINNKACNECEHKVYPLHLD